MPNTVLEIVNLSKYYGSNKAIDDVSFKLNSGKCLALLGPNGSGKTSILECIEGLREHTSGKILLNGRIRKTHGKDIQKLLGVQLQAASLPQGITVVEAMELSCAYHGVDTRTDLLERFGLGQYKKKEFSKLSVGQQRKLMLALAISHDPKLLILDEPTASLDVMTRNELHVIIEELKQENTAILLASHDMAEVEKIVDHISIMDKGKIVKEGNPIDFTSHNEGAYKISIKTKNNSLIEFKGLDKVEYIDLENDYVTIMGTNIEDILLTIIQEIKKNNDCILDIRIKRPSLEEEFIKIVN